MMKIGKKGLELIKGFESFVGYVYDDKRAPIHGKYREWNGEKVIGTLTIGYGHTDMAKHPLKITQGLRITQAKAIEILDVDLDDVEADVNRYVKVKMTQGQFDALVSFTFNCGAGNLKKLAAPMNAGDYATTRRNFDHYIRSKGEVMNGLVRRRDAEQALFDDRYNDVVIPTEIVHHTNDVDAAKPPKTMATSTEGNAAIGGGLLGAVQTAGDVSGSLKDIHNNAADSGVFAILGRVISSPGFWIGVGIVGVCIYLWVRRRYRLHVDFV